MANVPSDLSLPASGIQGCSAGDVPNVPKAWESGASVCAHYVLKQVRVGSGSFEPNLIVKNLVDQKPIGLNMTVPVASPIPTELMIAILRRKWPACKEEVDNSFQFCEVFASLLCPLDVLLELICLAEPHLSQEA